MAGMHKWVRMIRRQKINLNIFTLCCIIHLQALCAQTFLAEIDEVMNFGIKLINSILAKALYHRLFKEFLEEIENHYSELLLHNKRQCLSRSNVLKRLLLVSVK